MTPCHLTAPRGVESLVQPSLLLLTTHSYVSRTLEYRVWAPTTNLVFFFLFFFLLICCFSVIRALDPCNICLGLNLFYVCVALTWEHENLAGSTNIRGFSDLCQALVTLTTTGL